MVAGGEEEEDSVGLLLVLLLSVFSGCLLSKPAIEAASLYNVLLKKRKKKGDK